MSLPFFNCAEKSLRTLRCCSVNFIALQLRLPVHPVGDGYVANYGLQHFLRLMHGIKV